MKRVWRWALLAIAGILLLLLTRPLCVVGGSAVDDHVDHRPELPASFVDDASRLEKTAVQEVFSVPSSMAEAEPALRSLLARARLDGARVSIAGARHTQGGHTIAAEGIVIDMTPLRTISPDAEASILRVEAGARWTDVIDELDPRFAVAVMQSNDTFTVGGTLGANAHGWQTRRSPVSSTVRSFRLMTADGKIHHCSREQNTDLFGGVLGGYGLLGIVLDVELDMVANARYQATREAVPVSDYPEAFRLAVVEDSTAALAYGRVSVVPGGAFLEEAILTVFRPTSDQADLPPVSQGTFSRTRRSLFRASVHSAYGKRVRWTAEKNLGRLLSAKTFTRNDLMSQGVEVYENRTANTTDILHEYFVPRDRFVDFVRDLQRIIPGHDVNLLNVTVRDVLRDDDSVLRYADQDMFAFVMLFNQQIDERAEMTMAELTRELVDATLELGGRHYLPYRLHPTPQQVRRAYPRLDEFAALKRKHDPRELWSNAFYRRYLDAG